MGRGKRRVGLTRLELEVMGPVWERHPEPVAVRDLLDRLNAGRPKPLAYNTVHTVLTLLKARGEPRRASRFGELIFGGQFNNLSRLFYLGEVDILAAWEVFRTYQDKDWSFTDCTSKVVIEKLAIASAFAFDQHFRQFGTVTVVP